MPYIKPGSSEVRPVNEIAQNLSLAFLQASEGFVAGRVFPVLPVDKTSGTYLTYTRADWNRDEMELRGLAAPSAGGHYGMSTDTYSCDRWAIHRDVPNQLVDDAADVVDLRAEAAQYLALQNLLRREVEFATAFMGQSIWGTDFDISAGTQWSAATGTDPIGEIATGVRTVQLATGVKPNIMVCGKLAYDTLKNNEQVIDRLNRGQTPVGPAMATRAQLASLFELDEVLVMDAVRNTAAEQATESNAFIGSQDDVLITYRPPTAGRMTASGGYTFTWRGNGANAEGIKVTSFDMPELDSTRYELDSWFDMKLVSSALGYYMYNASA